jgi:hypothetical protein
MSVASDSGYPRLMPDLVLPSLDGPGVDLSRFRGRKLVLFIWASW